MEVDKEELQLPEDEGMSKLMSLSSEHAMGDSRDGSGEVLKCFSTF